MYVILISSFIVTLIVFMINSIYATSSYKNGFWPKNEIIKRLSIGEKKIYYAINTICENDIDFCLSKDDGTGKLVFSLSDFNGYNINIDVPSSWVSTYTTISIDDNKTFTIEHLIKKQDQRSAYIDNSFALDGNITCSDGSALPCNDFGVTKTMKLLEESRNSFIDKRIEELDEIINDPNSSISEKIEAQNEKNDLEDEKDVNNDIIANRPNLIP